MWFFLNFILTVAACIGLPWLVISYHFGQFQVSRKNKGGLWLCRDTFWIQDTLDMTNDQIKYFQTKGWKFEDYRVKTPNLKVVN